MYCQIVFCKDELCQIVYRISSNKTRGYYFFAGPSTAGIIRMRVLFEGVDYSKKVPTLENFFINMFVGTIIERFE